MSFLLEKIVLYFFRSFVFRNRWKHCIIEISSRSLWSWARLKVSNSCIDATSSKWIVRFKTVDTSPCVKFLFKLYLFPNFAVPKQSIPVKYSVHLSNCSIYLIHRYLSRIWLMWSFFVHELSTTSMHIVQWSKFKSVPVLIVELKLSLFLKFVLRFLELVKKDDRSQYFWKRNLTRTYLLLCDRFLYVVPNLLRFFVRKMFLFYEIKIFYAYKIYFDNVWFLLPKQ